MNISSFQKLNRMLRLFQFMMNQYQEFVSQKLDKKYLDLFMDVNKVTDKISKIENKVVEPSKIKLRK